MAGDEFGWGVAIDAGTIVAGSHGRDDLGAFSGAVYTFERPGTAPDNTYCSSDSTDGSDHATTDVAVPASGSVFHYLVRAQNDCPAGQGTLGHDSQGVERSALICP